MATQRTSVELPASPAPLGNVARQLDRLAYEQALVDAELATARVVELTHRIVDLASENRVLRQEVAAARADAHAARVEIDQVKSTRAYALAHKLWSLRSVLGL